MTKKVLEHYIRKEIDADIKIVTSFYYTEGNAYFVKYITLDNEHKSCSVKKNCL